MSLPVVINTAHVGLSIAPAIVTGARPICDRVGCWLMGKAAPKKVIPFDLDENKKADKAYKKPFDPVSVK